MPFPNFQLAVLIFSPDLNPVNNPEPGTTSSPLPIIRRYRSYNPPFSLAGHPLYLCCGWLGFTAGRRRRQQQPTLSFQGSHSCLVHRCYPRPGRSGNRKGQNQDRRLFSRRRRGSRSGGWSTRNGGAAIRFDLTYSRFLLVTQEAIISQLLETTSESFLPRVKLVSFFSITFLNVVHMNYRSKERLWSPYLGKKCVVPRPAVSKNVNVQSLMACSTAMNNQKISTRNWKPHRTFIWEHWEHLKSLLSAQVVH